MTVVLPKALVQDPKTFGKVAVLMGGRSAEREISLKSGNAVLEALVKSGVDAHGVDAGGDVLQIVSEGEFDRVFIALHGEGGEDGTIQGALETIGMPYTGSGVLGSALAMDKLRAKQLWLGADLPTPPFALLGDETGSEDIVRELGLPLIVKPVSQGSSIGMTKVVEHQELNQAWRVARGHDPLVLVERWVEGREYTVAILQEQTLPVIELETPRAFYDFEAKYEASDTQYICPCGLEPGVEQAFQSLALKAFKALGCHGWGRVDLMVDDSGAPWLLEANTVPGMTDHSLVPMAARHAGMPFEQLVWRILETSLSVA